VRAPCYIQLGVSHYDMASKEYLDKGGNKRTVQRLHAIQYFLIVGVAFVNDCSSLYVVQTSCFSGVVHRYILRIPWVVPGQGRGQRSKVQSGVR